MPDCESPNRVRAVKVAPVTAEPDPARVNVPYVSPPLGDGVESDELEPDPPQPDKRTDARKTVLAQRMIDLMIRTVFVMPNV